MIEFFKYHWDCKELKIFHLCFADDLLVLCHGDLKSVKVVKRALDMFNCKSLIDKVKLKVSDWKNRMVSYAGRLQLIASILSSMQVYWASVFILPKSVIKEVNKLLKGFLWLLMANHLWNIASMKESLWVKWINVFRLKGESIWDVDCENNSSYGWKQILSLRDKMRNHSTSVPLPNFDQEVKNVILWKTKAGQCGNFSTNNAWNDWRSSGSIVEWCDSIWFSNYTTKHSFIFWMSVQVWKVLKSASNQNSLPDKWDDIISTLANQKHNKSIKSVLRRLTLKACVYYIWQERNKRIFTSDKKNSNELVAEVFNHLRLKFASLTVKRTAQVVELIELVLALGGTLLCALSLLVDGVHKEGFLNEKGFMNFGMAMFAGRKRRAMNMGILVPSSTLLGG
ncbi:hypothetical protein Tco_0126716 [Tanacetum coccineum]